MPANKNNNAAAACTERYKCGIPQVLATRSRDYGSRCQRSREQWRAQMAGSRAHTCHRDMQMGSSVHNEADLKMNRCIHSVFEYESGPMSDLPGDVERCLKP